VRLLIERDFRTGRRVGFIEHNLREFGIATRANQ